MVKYLSQSVAGLWHSGEGYDPWQVAITRLCDPWSEWDGMQDIVADERATARERT